MTDSTLDDGFILDKKIGVNQPKQIENAEILLANTAMDTDKIKIFGSRVSVDGAAKVAEIELAEKQKMKEKVEKILTHNISCFINRYDPVKFREDLMNISRTTLSSKLLTQHEDFFAKMGVDAVLRLKGSGNLEAIQIIKKLGGTMTDSTLDEEFILDKKIGVNQPKRIENAKILLANTAMDTDKIKIFGSRVRVDGAAKVAEIELAENRKLRKMLRKS